MNLRTSPLAGWVITQLEGKSYLGKLATPMPLPPGDGPMTLNPVYEYALVPVQTPQGIAAQPTIKPPFGLMSVRSLTLPRPGIWVAGEALNTEEQQYLAQLIEQTENAIRAQSAQAAGLTLAPANAKLPPMPGLGNGGRR